MKLDCQTVILKGKNIYLNSLTSLKQSIQAYYYTLQKLQNYYNTLEKQKVQNIAANVFKRCVYHVI